MTDDTHPNLNALLKAAAKYTMTPRDIWQQRVSWTYGQMIDCAPYITLEDVRLLAIKEYGACPKEASSSETVEEWADRIAGQVVGADD